MVWIIWLQKNKNQDNELNLHTEAFGHIVSHHYLSVKISGVWSTCKTVLWYERDNLFKENKKNQYGRRWGKDMGLLKGL